MMQTRDELCAALGIPFSEEQLDAITAPLEPAVVIAGAGSGKTTVMAARVVWLVATGQVQPDQVLGLTFTRKAAAELASRIRSSLAAVETLQPSAEEAGEPMVLTYDAFAGRLVAEHGLRLGKDNDPRLLTGASSYRVAAEAVMRHRGPLEYLSSRTPSSVVSKVLSLDHDLASHLVTPEQARGFNRRFADQLQQAPRKRDKTVYASILEAQMRVGERAELLDLVEEYRTVKHAMGAVEFSDQMETAARLVREVPIVARTLREQFSVVLLDEYQDTSSAQAQLLRGIFSGPDLENGQGFPVTAVGDPFQAIYGWRGAAAANIVTFAAEFPRVDGSAAALYGLSVNRRSGTHILDAANHLAEPLRLDPMVDASTVVTLTAPQDKEPGEVRVATFSTWEDEVAWIVDTIEQLHRRHIGGVQRWSDIAILVRRNAEIGPLFGELIEREIPAEIVGLGGLLSVPEVADVVATLRVLGDVTANAALVRLLTGPRWAIGREDLALLGQRAAQIARQHRTDPVDDAVTAELDQAVSGTDPVDIACLCDALDDLGPLPYSAEARERFLLYSRELAGLRAHIDEPLLDLVRRVISALGLDIELDASPALHHRCGRRQLAAFVDAVASYSDQDGAGSLNGLLCYLDAEVEHGQGLDQAMSGERDCVKILTVHRAKGLEWPAVFLPALVDSTFPTDRVSDFWVTNAGILPSPLRGDAASIPQLADASDQAFKVFKEDLRTQARFGEDRLAYVAATRARSLLIGTAHYWRASRAAALRLSDYFTTLVAQGATMVCEATSPAPGATNPLRVDPIPQEWPAGVDPEAAFNRAQAAAAVRAAIAAPISAPASVALEHAEIFRRWDREIAALTEEATVRETGGSLIALPSSLTATQLMHALDDVDRFTTALARPMPRPPSPAASFGTQFHEWVEARFRDAALFDIEDAIESAQSVSATETEFQELCDLFLAGQFADRSPHRIEQPFAIVVDTPVGPTTLRGRIDAVYAEADGTWLVLDWKTSRREIADPLQLAIYRLAWAEIAGVAPEQVTAAFYYVRTDRLDTPDILSSRTEIGALVGSLVT